MKKKRVSGNEAVRIDIAKAMVWAMNWDSGDPELSTIMLALGVMVALLDGMEPSALVNVLDAGAYVAEQAMLGPKGPAILDKAMKDRP